MKAALGLACVSGSSLVISLSTAVEIAQLTAAAVSILAGIGSLGLCLYNWKKAYDNAKAPPKGRKARRR